MYSMEMMEKEKIKEIVKANEFKHLAVIMDGNRRWAKERNLPSAFGHKKGVTALKNTVRNCDKYGIEYLTVYAFSTENWNRKKEEVDFLMGLINHIILFLGHKNTFFPTNHQTSCIILTQKA